MLSALRDAVARAEPAAVHYVYMYIYMHGFQLPSMTTKLLITGTKESWELQNSRRVITLLV